MCLYKFTHIPLLKNDALLKKKKKKVTKKAITQIYQKIKITRKNKNKKSQKKKKKKKKEEQQRLPRKSKKEEVRSNVQTRKKKNKKTKQKKPEWTSPCPSAHGHFCHLLIKYLPLSFLFILERKHFGGPGEKTLRPYHLFSFLLTQPNTL